MRAGWKAYEQTLFLNDRDRYKTLGSKTYCALFSAVLLFNVCPVYFYNPKSKSTFLNKRAKYHETVHHFLSENQIL